MPLEAPEALRDKALVHDSPFPANLRLIPHWHHQ